MARCKPIVCWGETFRSLRAVCKDKRCIVSKDAFRERLKQGWDAQDAATQRTIRDHTRETEHTKFCEGCQQLKSLSEFSPASKFRKGVVCRCKACVTPVHRNYILRTIYGITLEEFNKLAKKQKGKCAVCKQPTEKLVVDHNHGTGAVRKLLCNNCNTALGLFGDSVSVCRSAAKYLQKFSTNNKLNRP